MKARKGMVLGECAFAHHCCYYGCAHRLGQFAKLIPGLCSDHTATGNARRSLGLDQ